MNKCELALEEDALITSEQLEPQGTLWTLKKHKTCVTTQGKKLKEKTHSAELPNSKCREKENRNIMISCLHNEKIT